MMSREHQALIRQFIEFRTKTWEFIESLKESGHKMMLAERAVAQAYPVYDYRLLTDQFSPFKLYDCLKPELYENMKKPVEIYENHSHAEDIKLKI